MKRFVQFVIFGVCVAFSVATVYNVFSDNAAVEHLAKLAACADGAAQAGAPRPKPDAACKPVTTRLERTPFGQAFELVVSKRTVSVRCSRDFVLVGEYSCKVE